MTEKSSHSQRVALAASLSSRERRTLLKQLSEAQDALEQAEEQRRRAIVKVWKRGLSYSAIAGVVTVGPETIAKIVKAAQSADAG